MNKEVAISPVDKLKAVLGGKIIKEQLDSALKDNADLFAASIIDIFASDNQLQKCNPLEVAVEALKAAMLKLPINKSIGFAYIIAYKNKPSFQLGYKGLIQLAKRSGVYTAINADFVYEGEVVTRDRMTGNITIEGNVESGNVESGNVIGFFAYFREVNGFEKSTYRTMEEAKAHAGKYSKTYKYKSGPWKTEENKMHRKGVLRDLLASWGTLSIELSGAVAYDFEGDSAIEAEWKGAPTVAGAIEGVTESKSIKDKLQGKVQQEEQEAPTEDKETVLTQY